MRTFAKLQVYGWAFRNMPKGEPNVKYCLDQVLPIRQNKMPWGKEKCNRNLLQDYVCRSSSSEDYHSKNDSRSTKLWQSSAHLLVFQVLELYI